MKLLTPKLIHFMYGLSLPNAYRIVHAHGIKIGGQFFIDQDRMESVLRSEKRI